MTPPPFQIVAAGICPAGLSTGQRAPDVVGAVVIRGATGFWNITISDPTAQPGNCALILSPGGGSNFTGGISFGQSTQVGQDFTFTSYRNSTGLAFDVETQFMIVKWPNAAEG